MMHENIVVSMPFIQIDVSLHAAKFMTITLFTFIHVLDPRGVSSINKDDHNSIRIMNCVCMHSAIKNDLQKHNATCNK